MGGSTSKEENSKEENEVDPVDSHHRSLRNANLLDTLLPQLTCWLGKEHVLVLKELLYGGNPAAEEVKEALDWLKKGVTSRNTRKLENIPVEDTGKLAVATRDCLEETNKMFNNCLELEFYAVWFVAEENGPHGKVLMRNLASLSEENKFEISTPECTLGKGPRECRCSHKFHAVCETADENTSEDASETADENTSEDASKKFDVSVAYFSGGKCVINAENGFVENGPMLICVPCSNDGDPFLDQYCEWYNAQKVPYASVFTSDSDNCRTFLDDFFDMFPWVEFDARKGFSFSSAKLSDSRRPGGCARRRK